MRVQMSLAVGVNGLGDYFQLDDTTEGKLDNTTYVLGGVDLVDVTDYTRDVAISRGRSMTLARTITGLASLTLDNRDRRFDPTHLDGPYYGSVFPNAAVIIDIGGENLYVGSVEDWKFDWMVNGDSVVEVQCTDALTQLAEIDYPAGTSIQELSSDRITRVLDAADWPLDQRVIGSGDMLMAADARTDATNAFDYITRVALSERGFAFVNRDGDFQFLPSNFEQTGGTAKAQFGDAVGQIRCVDINMTYGVEELINSVDVIWSAGTSVGGTATYTDTISVGRYGTHGQDYNTLLTSQIYAQAFAEAQVAQYSQSRLRFNAVAVNYGALGTADQATILGLELGDVVRVTYTPNSIGTAINQLHMIDQIQHDASPRNHEMRFVLSEVPAVCMILDDASLGDLDSNYLAF